MFIQTILQFGHVIKVLWLYGIFDLIRFKTINLFLVIKFIAKYDTIIES